MDVPVIKNGFFGATDARVHARYIMTLASITTFMSAVAMQPIYVVITLQKILSCTLNDVSATLENFVENAKDVAAGGKGRTKQLSLRLSFGSKRVQDAISESGVATCFSEDLKQGTQDSMTQIGTRSGAGPLKMPAKVATLISGFLDNAADAVTRAFVVSAYHVIDVFLAWMLGVVRGVQDIAQTLDWNKCKLPVIDDGLKSYGLCACGDDSYAIPKSSREQTWAQGAFWCSGFLMLNEADGSDVVIWNPFSLAELLQAPSEVVAASAADAYILCLRNAPPIGGASQCAGHRPRLRPLEQQGVEVMQVVARCRANYQNARWDEASVLYALFPRSAWAELWRDGVLQGELGLGDKWHGIRGAMVSAMKKAGSVKQTTGLTLNAETWACLDDALRGGALSHSCHRWASSAPGRDFSYAPVTAGLNFAAIDACRAFSGPAWIEEDTGALALGLPRTMWSGGSTTRAPVAQLHPVEKGDAEREADALEELRNYMKTEIEPMFAKMEGGKLQKALTDYLDVKLWSVEGDALHQFVDCVVLGPYAAADLAHNVHDGAGRLPVPQYHRGVADSREFCSWGETGGTTTRRAFVNVAVSEISEAGASVVASEAWRHFVDLRSRWLGDSSEKEGVPRGLLCACEKPGQLWKRIPDGIKGSLSTVGDRLQLALIKYWGDEPVHSVGASQVVVMEQAAGQRFEFGTCMEKDGNLYQITSYNASVTCCATQVASGRAAADMFFAADVPFERREWDIGNRVLDNTLARLANSTVWERMLNGENWTHVEREAALHKGAAYKAPARLKFSERARLREAQLFEPSHAQPVRAYDELETADELGGETLWQACNERVAGLYTTLPWARGEGDNSRGVVQGANEAADALQDVFENGVRVSGVHALEAAVDRLLARAYALSPGFYTHAHRYVPSNSVWCEKDAAVADSANSGKRRSLWPAAAAVPPAALLWTDDDSIFNGLDKGEVGRILGPGPLDVLYPAATLERCACGWADAGACYVHPLACDNGTAALRVAPADAFLERDMRAWEELCGQEAGKYTTRKELLLVLRVLRRDSEREDAAPAWVAECDATFASTAWGLLDPEDETAWYSGEPSAGGAWRFDARRLATYGPGGLRLGLLTLNAPHKLRAHAALFNLGGDLRDNFIVPGDGETSEDYAHTIAQPVCRESLEGYLQQPLGDYFADVLLPMSHSVQLGAGAACGRWAVEEAIRAAFERAGLTTEAELERAAIQAEVADVWEARCVASAHSAGICAMRGVYDARAAPSAAMDAGFAKCAFNGPAHKVIGCTSFFYTPGCLLNCDGYYYDPCLCGGDGGASACVPRVFSPSACTWGRVGDAGAVAGQDPHFLLSSMQWPTRIDGGESDSDSHWESLRDSLALLKSSPREHNSTALYERAHAWLLRTLEDDVSPETAGVHAYCDDLHDYWPDAQHPVGYHPTTACRRNETATRGFSAWMSRDSEDKTFVDPVRLRNATRASEAFGAGHLVCDARAYAAPGVDLNPYYVRSRWKGDSKADPAVPRPAPSVDIDEMLKEGTPSFMPADSTLRQTGQQADALIGHSVGLVRSWARWISDSGDASLGVERVEMQGGLDGQWPHWISQESAAHFLNRDDTRPDGCSDPEQDFCQQNSDCAGGFMGAELVCLLNYAMEEDELSGICARAGTCYQHQHCQDTNPETLCSGEGKCVEPIISISNDMEEPIGFQLFSSTCSVDTQRLGRSEAIPDFARANGMCSFRDWYHYVNNTQAPGAVQPPGKNFFETPDRLFHRTDEFEAKMLWGDHKTLAHSPVACDRSYQHSEFRACGNSDLRSRAQTSGPSPKDALQLNATRTWINKNGFWHARFCALQRDEWFLSPYFSDNGLKSTPREIQRCSRFRVCPSIPFEVRGQSVAERRVLIWKKDGVESDDRTRSYCTLDAARCGSFGQMVQSTETGIDCRDAAKHTKCRVDRLTSPLISIVFGDEVQFSTALDTQKLSELRQHCPYAFIESISEKMGIDLFSRIREILTTEYDSQEPVRKKQVHAMTNALVFAVFGIGEYSGRGLERKTSFGSIKEDTQFDAYIKQGSCVRYVAQRMKEKEIEYSQITGLDYEIDAYDYTSPGTSLYLFADRVTIFVPMRWLMQCVVWADSAELEGGVHADFVKHVVDGDIVDVVGAAQCQNWKDSFNDNKIHESMTLKKRLLTSTSIFTVTENEDFGFNDRQIVRDLNTAVAWALDQIGARDRPDLWCLQDDEIETRTGEVNFAADNRNRSSFLGFIIGKTVSAYDTFASNEGVQDMNSLVRKFIFKQEVEDVMKWTHADLFDKGLLEERSDDLHDEVKGTDIRWSMYEFTELKNKQMSESITENKIGGRPTWDTYLGAIQNCGVGKKRLKSPEYSLGGIALDTCNDFQKDLFTCNILNTYVLDYKSRASSKKTLFLRSDELLVLVLHLVKRAMYNSHMGGFADLHIPHSRETGDWGGILDLFRDVRDNAAAEVEDPLGLKDVSNVEILMETLSESGVECSPDNNVINEITNPQHLELRQCLEDLIEEVGWVVEAKQHNPQTLDIPVTAAMLLKGFYPAFEQVSRHEEVDQDKRPDFRADHFLRDLFGGIPGPQLKGEPICFSSENSGGDGADEAKLVTKMTPFWGEFFDVAHTGGSAKGSLASAKGCDMKRSGPENSILVFSTLCAPTGSSGNDVCEQHPNYLNQLRNVLPPECEELDGNRVHRDVLGAVEGTSLCERRPRLLDTECGMEHGLLHGRRGTKVLDLDTVETVDTENTQSGLWNRSNSLFRADEAESFTLSEDATALQLKKTDIGGNRLAFRVSAGGVLRLESASMKSNPGQIPVPGVREWLAHVEDNFAEQQRQYEFVNVVTENGGSSWRCPLHWMQTFVSADNVLDQARAPVSTRNAARFEHITGLANRYAHPTMLSSTKIEGLHAARFLSDGLACVGKGLECHGKAHLTESVSALLKDEWRKVKYVGADSCSRVLDWPEEKVNPRA